MDTVLDLIVDNKTQAGTAIFAVIPFSFNLFMYIKGSFSLQMQTVLLRLIQVVLKCSKYYYKGSFTM